MNFVEIDSISIGNTRRETGNIDDLAESIASLGLLNPVTITDSGRLIAGYHRIKACKQLGWEKIPVIVMPLTGLKAELAEIDENLIRNELTVLERGEQLKRRKEIYEALNPETKKGGAPGKAGGGKTKSPGSGSFVSDTAKKTNRGRSTISEEVQIATKLDAGVKEKIRGTDLANSKTDLLELARKTKEEQGEIAEQITSGKAKNVREAVASGNRKKREEKIGQIAHGNKPLEAPKQFPLIYADPPWRYEHVKTESRAIENQYPTMDLSEICALPVANVTTDDCVLFMWATSPKLAESMKVLESWGFTYRTCMVWVKDKIGMGYWVRQQHELLLIATKGNPPPPEPNKRCSSVVNAPRGEHSEKPEKFYEILEDLYPHWPRMEMFCRAPRDGWFAWGNQA